MIIKVVLSVGLALLFVYALSQRKRSGPLSNLMMGATVVGVLLVLFPNMSTVAATALGVGRGADLIFYVFILCALIAIFNVHVHLRANSVVTTDLARSIALLDPLLPKAEHQGTGHRLLKSRKIKEKRHER
jgi:hypothetical protein